MESSPLGGRLTLEDCRPGDLVRVRGILGEEIARTEPSLLRGDVLQYIDHGEEGITVARNDGSRTVIPVERASVLGIEVVPDHLLASPEAQEGTDPSGSDPPEVTFR